MSDTDEVVVVATIFPQPERREDVRQAIVTEVARVHAEDEGCLLFALHEKKDRFVLIERWTSRDALSAHAQTDGYATLASVLSETVTSPPDVQFLKAVPAGTDSQGRL